VRPDPQSSVASRGPLGRGLPGRPECIEIVGLRAHPACQPTRVVDLAYVLTVTEQPGCESCPQLPQPSITRHRELSCRSARATSSVLAVVFSHCGFPTELSEPLLGEARESDKLPHQAAAKSDAPQLAFGNTAS